MMIPFQFVIHNYAKVSVGFHFIYGSSIYIVMTRDGISFVCHIHSFAFGWIQSKLPFYAPALDII